jgi:hypothetical protein
MRKNIKITYRESPQSEWKTRTVYAFSIEHARLLIKFENAVTHNQIEFKN